MPVKSYTTYKSLINNHAAVDGFAGHALQTAAVKDTAEILLISSFPPRECGIATYSQDLVMALQKQFSQSFNIRVCPLETDAQQHRYPTGTKYVLNTDRPETFIRLANAVRDTAAVKMVMIQHEFGLFAQKEALLLSFLESLTKPVVTVFHTVLPSPNNEMAEQVKEIARLSAAVVVMTETSAGILVNDYGLAQGKITVIPHGTHLVPHANKKQLKEKYHLIGKKILSTFGLLSSGKGIETTLDALPAIVQDNPDVMFLVIGKTHPCVVTQEGEQYRRMLEQKVKELGLQKHVQFVNRFLPLPQLLEYLQLTDIYLFTSRDPNQAVSGTFAYALSCGCAVVSTPIAHAKEVLEKGAGMAIDFGNHEQLGAAVNELLGNEEKRKNLALNGLHYITSSAWENSAITHARLFETICAGHISLQYNIPAIKVDHIKKMTTSMGMIQFSHISDPDIESGYTLDDNARAMIAMCMHYELTGDADNLQHIGTYLRFIKYCLQAEGYFLNYVCEKKTFTPQNYATNLADANGRAIWALGYLLSMEDKLPAGLVKEAGELMRQALLHVNHIHSSRAMAFIIKGLYYRNLAQPSDCNRDLIKHFADRLVQMYRHETDERWQWFESYLTYANSVLPEAVLCAWLTLGGPVYKEIARTSFDFLLRKTFTPTSMRVISNKTWLHNGREIIQHARGGEQPIDVAYTILALDMFGNAFNDDGYRAKIKTAFSWFLGNNHLHQVMYNPCTGGCYDGLEETSVNLNQGAESTISYLLARLTIEKYDGVTAKEIAPQALVLQKVPTA